MYNLSPFFPLFVKISPYFPFFELILRCAPRYQWRGVNLIIKSSLKFVWYEITKKCKNLSEVRLINAVGISEATKPPLFRR